MTEESDLAVQYKRPPFMGVIMNPWVGMTDILGSANSTSRRVVKAVLSEIVSNCACQCQRIN